MINPAEIRAWTARQRVTRRAYYTDQDQLKHKEQPSVRAKRQADRRRYQAKKEQQP